MRRLKLLTIAAAVTAAFAAPAALAQATTTTPDSPRIQQRDAAGHPSGSPTQPPRSMSGDGSMNDPTLRSGRMGAQYDSGTVRNVQQALQDKGFDVGAVDGVMGPRTESALRQFQQQQGISASGHLDRRTLGALNVSDATGSRSDRPAGAAGTGNPGSGTIGTSPSGAATPPTSGTMGSSGATRSDPDTRTKGPASSGNPGSGTIGTSPSGASTPPASSTTGTPSGRGGG
jgi:peptidoglycan hydrolase-like protein with peptidoglycan-binding domain